MGRCAGCRRFCPRPMEARAKCGFIAMISNILAIGQTQLS